MHSVLVESAGNPAVPPPPKVPEGRSGSLPFGQHIQLSSIKGSKYLTAQALVQHVAYILSDKIFSYAEDFELDVTSKIWAESGETNAYGNITPVTSMQTRNGAASAVLGYIFSSDFDAKRRHIPQTILASSAGLNQLRSSLRQLTFVYHSSSPFVAHIAAINFNAGDSKSLISQYVPALSIAENLRIGLVVSSSTFEAQHMALLGTLMSRIVPSLHIYDGVTVGRETSRIDDLLDRQDLHSAYENISSEITSPKAEAEQLEKRVQRLLKSFNAQLGTAYQFFEYEGHAEAEQILVVLGTVESSVSAQVAASLARKGEKVGVVSVRIYGPFLEEELLRAIPASAKNVLVLGQVRTQQIVEDPAESSHLFGNVLAAVQFSDRWQHRLKVEEIKYASVQFLEPEMIISTLRYMSRRHQRTGEHESVSEVLETGEGSAQQYVFWELDDSTSKDVPTILSRLFSANSKRRVSINSHFDNLTQGGVIRTKLRDSNSSQDTVAPTSSADIVFVGDFNVLKSFDTVRALKTHGAIILKHPGLKPEEVEKKLPLPFRKSLASKSARLFTFDIAASPMGLVSPDAESYLTQLAVLKLTRPDTLESDIEGLATINSDSETLNGMLKDLEKALCPVEVLESWATEETDQEIPVLPHNVNINSFAPFAKEEPEDPAALESWESAAKSLAFPEALDTQTSLRPDLPTATHTAYVKENRRLTPTSYDRNIFHIEFDIGESGLQYQIGEALGIHAENDPEEVSAFIKFYGLHADDLVRVPSLKDPSTLETRTVYQSLLQNIDIFGRPPKKFYEALAEFATDDAHKKALQTLCTPDGSTEFKRRAEVDTCTFADVLAEFPSAHPAFHDLARIVTPMKRREYSIASSQRVTPTSVALLVVVVSWTDPRGRPRWGQATRFLQQLRVGAPVTVSVKPSVMKLPTLSTAPIIMAGLGTGLAPFRAFVQHRAYQRDVLNEPIGPVLLYMGSRHQREEYLYGEEWEAYRDAGIVTLLGRAFSRDQPQKIYIQDRMRQTLPEIMDAYLEKEGSFYLCGPTWPVPDVTDVLEEAIRVKAKGEGRKIASATEIQRLKEEGRYVLEVY